MSNPTKSDRLDVSGVSIVVFGLATLLGLSGLSFILTEAVGLVM